MAFPREVINVHVGKAGIEIGKTCWELFGSEQGIIQDGSLSEDTVATAWTTFYRETVDNKFVPRAVFADLEPKVIDSLRQGPQKELFRSDQMLSLGKDDAACLYARGYYTLGKDKLEAVVESLRHQVELADSPQGFLSYHSLGGGTGSGFSSLILERLTGDYPDIPLLEYSVLPTPQVSPYFVEPYNIGLATHTKLEYTNNGCTFLLDNKSLYNICKAQLDIEQPQYLDMNQVASHVIGSITAGMRYPEHRLACVNDVTKLDLTPFPRIHFPIVSYAPFVSPDRASHSTFTCDDLTNAVLSQENQLVACDDIDKHGKYISCCLLYRGQNINVEEVNISTELLKGRLLSFSEWSLGDPKIAVHKQPLKNLKDDCMGEVKQSAVLMANSTAVKSVWAHVGEHFDLLLGKKAFVHWYLEEGMDIQEFYEARECLETLTSDYQEIEDLSGSNSSRAI